jgi:hypothetical protein
MQVKGKACFTEGCSACAEPTLDSVEHPNAAAFKRAIPPEHWKAVFHDNAVKVFKLKGIP